MPAATMLTALERQKAEREKYVLPLPPNTESASISCSATAYTFMRLEMYSWLILALRRCKRPEPLTLLPPTKKVRSNRGTLYGRTGSLKVHPNAVFLHANLFYI